MSGRLEGKVAVVTGAAGGIGRGVVERYVAEGARVVAVDRSVDGVEALRRDFADSLIPVVGDVAAWSTNAEAARVAVEDLGGLDVFVGNAGISDHGRPLESLGGEEIPAAFHELFGINVKSYMLGARACLDGLLTSGGCIILTASFASFNPAGGGILYTASKHAVLGVVRQLAYELAPDVRVNGVAPGVAPTRLGGVESLDQAPADAVLPGSEEMLPLGQVPAAESYAGAFVYLASATESAQATGSVVTADSGLSVRGIARPGGRTDEPAGARRAESGR